VLIKILSNHAFMLIVFKCTCFVLLLMLIIVLMLFISFLKQAGYDGGAGTSSPL
jgi:hypothetical protein